VKCPNCQSEADALFIDTHAQHGTPEREKRYCVNCKPEILSYPPREMIKLKSWYGYRGGGRYVQDRLKEYPLSERLKDARGYWIH
jgi:hypothetical protein